MIDLNITEIRIKKLNKESPIKAFASVTISNAIAIHGIKVLDGKDGLYIAMPSRKEKDKHFDIAHPINPEARELLEHAVIEAYGSLNGKTMGRIPVTPV